MAIYNTKVKELRTTSGLTLKEIAQRLGVTEATAQRYETGNGIKSIPYDKIVLYSEIFGVTPEYIMGWEVKKSLPDADKLADITLNPVIVNYAWKLLNLDDAKKNVVLELIDHLSGKE